MKVSDSTKGAFARVGIIALAGLDAETGVVMLLYLDQAYEKFKKNGILKNRHNLADAVYEGAVQRVRPKIMGGTGWQHLPFWIVRGTVLGF